MERTASVDAQVFASSSSVSNMVSAAGGPDDSQQLQTQSAAETSAILHSPGDRVGKGSFALPSTSLSASTVTAKQHAASPTIGNRTNSLAALGRTQALMGSTVNMVSMSLADAADNGNNSNTNNGDTASASAPSPRAASASGSPRSALERAGVPSHAPMRSVSETYQPTSAWFEGHYYYTSHLVPFFSSENVIRRSAAAAAAGLEDEGSTKQLLASLSNREHNLSAVHHTLYLKAHLHNGVLMLPISEFSAFIRTLVTPAADISSAERWVRHVGLVENGAVAYEDLVGALDRLFNGEQRAQTAERCFKLCDVTRADHILKPVFQAMRDDEKCPDDGDITYLVVHGIMRAFERVAKIEEEEVRTAFLKKNKKMRKKKDLVLPMPSKRQFHISPEEFSKFLSEDPYLVLAFLPYAIKSALYEDGAGVGPKSPS